MTKDPPTSKLDDLAATVQELATPGTKAKEIISAVRERHPGASKKDVIQAAFYALTGGIDADSEKARRIHEMAITERGTDDDARPASDKPKKTKRKGKGGTAPRQA